MKWIVWPESGEWISVVNHMTLPPPTPRVSQHLSISQSFSLPPPVSNQHFPHEQPRFFPKSCSWYSSSNVYEALDYIHHRLVSRHVQTNMERAHKLLHRKVPSPILGSNPGLSGCETTALTTAPPCRPRWLPTFTNQERHSIGKLARRPTWQRQECRKRSRFSSFLWRTSFKIDR